MILGLGNDIVQISRVQSVWEAHGGRFAERILHAQELAEFAEISHKPERFLAKRFAAKEAAAKALGLGFRQGLHFRDIIITHDNLGRPELKWQGVAATRLALLQATSSLLSISDEQDYVVATVILQS